MTAIAATAASVSLLIVFIGSVFLFCLSLLATPNGGVENGIPIPSCRHFVVECFICFFCLAHCCGERKFTGSRDTSCVEVFSLFQSGFNCCAGFAFYPAPIREHCFGIVRGKMKRKSFGFIGSYSEGSSVTRTSRNLFARPRS